VRTAKKGKCERHRANAEERRRIKHVNRGEETSAKGPYPKGGYVGWIGEVSTDAREKRLELSLVGMKQKVCKNLGGLR